MHSNRFADAYSPAEIAEATGVDVADVAARVGDRRFVPHGEAVRIGRALIARRRAMPVAAPAPLLAGAIDAETSHLPASRGVPLALSSTVHVAAVAVVLWVATVGMAPAIATATSEERADPMRLVFLATPGPGGGGGGGGLRQPAPAPKAKREGHHALSSPIPERQPAPATVPPPRPEPPRPLEAEQLPPVIAPVVAAPADSRNRVGVLEQTTADNDSHGPGKGGGAGTGTGTGIGSGEGSGIGPGSGGGTGGGPYRPGSGIQPPRLLAEVKADYTEDARKRGVAGEVLLEIVVRRDGSVGDVKILQGLGYGLNDRAVQAVRQWRFAPATRLGAAVDVVVEVAVEFKLR